MPIYFIRYFSVDGSVCCVLMYFWEYSNLCCYSLKATAYSQTSIFLLCGARMHKILERISVHIKKIRGPLSMEIDSILVPKDFSQGDTCNFWYNERVRRENSTIQTCPYSCLWTCPEPVPVWLYFELLLFNLWLKQPPISVRSSSRQQILVMNGDHSWAVLWIQYMAPHQFKLWITSLRPRIPPFLHAPTSIRLQDYFIWCWHHVTNGYWLPVVCDSMKYGPSMSHLTSKIYLAPWHKKTLSGVPTFIIKSAYIAEVLIDYRIGTGSIDVWICRAFEGIFCSKSTR